MQTLQTARLTTKRPPIPLHRSETIEERLLRVFSAPPPPPVRAPGILRQRDAHLKPKLTPVEDASPKTREVIGKFFASQGIPLNTVDSRGFRELVKYLDPKEVVPSEEEIVKFMDRQSMSPRSTVNFQKTVGPLSVTIDVAGVEDEKFLVFSIHYFQDFKERKNVVYLRKLLLSEFDASSFVNTIRRAVNNLNYVDVKFSNLVCPSDEVYSLLENTPVAKRVFMCCYQYMTKFVLDVLDINEFAVGLHELRTFVRFVKEESDRYSKFRRMQIATNGEMSVPDLNEGNWCDTAYFLTYCLVLHDRFNEYANRHHYNNYISTCTFVHLVYLQRLLQHCVQLCRTLSGPTSSISQVAYAYSSLKSFITENSMDYPFQSHIRHLVDEAFKDVSDPFYERLYNIATYLDPRYAYRDRIYSRPKWTMIEEWVVQDYVTSGPAPEKRARLIRQELVHYRSVSFVERPEESECPFRWWASRLLYFPILSEMSREYLATPAVSVDASFYFSGNGKFEHINDLYPTEKVQSCLTVAGNSQVFRGRGASEDKVTQKMRETLDCTAKRLQKASHFDLYTHHPAPTEEERNAILTAAFPPLPTLPNNMDKRYVPPHRRRAITFRGAELKDVPIRMKREEEIKEEIIDPELEIKQEPLDEVEEKNIELIHKTPPTTPEETAPEIQAPPILLPVKVRPRPDTSKIQKIPYSVQKRLGHPKFIPKHPLPPPISIRAPIHPRAPPKAPEPLKIPKEEEVLEIKLEPLDDFNPVLDNVFFPPPKVERLWTPVEAIERHRFKLETLKKRQKCNRRCAFCGELEIHELLKNVTIDNEKLIIMIAYIYRGEITIAGAKEFMARESKTYVCRAHYADAMNELYVMLRLNDGDFVDDASSDSIRNVMITAKQLRSYVTEVSLRMMLHKFVERNNHFCRVRPQVFGKESVNFGFYQPPQEKNDIDYETFIMPKHFRQPRKQLLELDSHDGTVKVIEQEEFKLPSSTTTADPPNDSSCPGGVCCYCAQRGSHMLKVPRGVDRLACWIDKLGPEFEKRLVIGEENLICSSHFPDEAFSSRGRLLKGMMPCSESEKVISTYCIQGDEFVKVGEQRTGSEKVASVNLDPNGAWSSLDDVKPAPVLQKRGKKSSRRRGRPRKSDRPKTPPEPIEQLSSEDDGDFFYDSEYDDFEEPALPPEEDDDYQLPTHYRKPREPRWVPKEEPTTTTRASCPREKKQEEEEYTERSEKPQKPKRARYNVRIGGKFAKREQCSTEESSST